MQIYSAGYGTRIFLLLLTIIDTFSEPPYILSY